VRTPEKKILLACSPSMHSCFGKRGKSVAAAWPSRSSKPRIESIALSDLLTNALSETIVKGLEGAAVLIALGADVPKKQAVRMIDNLRDVLASGVILYAPEHASLAAHQGAGLILEPMAADDARIAMELFTLAERESAVGMLRRDLRIAQAVQGGVSGEMNRIHDELSMAATIQRETLPKDLPQHEDVEFGVIFRPAAYVSGDIYDVARIDDRRIGFFIADAVGHGVPAALLTMVISRTLGITAGAGGTFSSPSEAITRLNDDMIRMQQGKARFATGVFGMLDTTTRELTITSAGHPAPLLVRDGHITELEVEGPLLGVFEGEAYEQFTFQLDPGDTVLLYSDGFETAFPDAHVKDWKPNQGSVRYMDYLNRLAWPNADGSVKLGRTLDELAGALDMNAGSLHQVDDITAVAISLRPVPVASSAA
jgi:phosphoserine phosphatase RsbU/P